MKKLFAEDKMKKKITSLLLAAIMIAAVIFNLFACNSDTAKPAASTEDRATEAEITEKATDPATDAVTEPQTNAATDKATEGQTTEKQTETDKTTDPHTTEQTVTEPPATEPPATEPPVTDPPATEPPATEPPVTEPPVTEPPVTEPPATEPPVTEPPKPEGPTDPAYVIFDKTKAKTAFSGANSVKAEVVTDPNEGNLVKLSTTAKSGDPYIFFNYESYVKAFGLTAVSADEYKYIIIRGKCENCSNGTFFLYYCSGSVYGAAGECARMISYDNGNDGWQYFIFNLNGAAKWNGKVHGMRIDWMLTCQGANECLYIQSIAFAKNQSEIEELIEVGEDPRAMTEEEKKQADKLIASATSQAPAVSNNKITAANEDAEINLWFDHSYNNTPAEDIKSTGKNTYQIKLAKNEIEGCHLMLASNVKKTGLTLQISDFVNEQGETLTKEICYGYYFDDVEGKTVADPIPLLEHEFDLTAKRSKMFIIKVKSTKDTRSGSYSADAVLLDSNGNEIKKAKIYAYVWNFTLPEASSCKTLTDLGWMNIYAGHRVYAGDDSLLYTKYYDYLLENKMCAYNLPFFADGQYSDDRVERYLDDPRVTAFCVCWKTAFNEDYVRKAYNRISKKQIWLEKAYFYPIDEPGNKAKLDEINNAGSLIKSVFGDGYKLIVPMHLNEALKTDGSLDWFEYVKGSVNVWCPHNYFFNDYADFSANPLLTYRCSTKIESKLGAFTERMAREQAEGDEVWWYVTRYPHNPEITLSISDKSVQHRLMFWQQKLYNVDGFLYYASNDWYHNDATMDTNRYMWDKKFEQDNSYPYRVYGNGVLVYCGAGLQEYLDRYSEGDYGAVGYYGPVGSLRLESVRDGIEDFDYFTLLDSLYGEGTSDLLIKKLTTSLGNYSTDTDLFNQLRTAAGDLIAAKSN
jgi:outer membrane biosynthesis protein TonB